MQPYELGTADMNKQSWLAKWIDVGAALVMALGFAVVISRGYLGIGEVHPDLLDPINVKSIIVICLVALWLAWPRSEDRSSSQAVAFRLGRALRGLIRR